jgi:hypothetical protein
MGQIREPKPVKLISSMFTADLELLEVARNKLSETFGPTDYESDLLPFDHTTYYAPEFGEGLMRKIVAFAELVDPGRLAEIKRLTNELETGWAREGKRRINLDPGYVSLAKLVLATTKNRGHRIYLGQGIYAEITLRYRNKTFQPWAWTYPDYASPPYITIFNHIRELYLAQLRLRSESRGV